jgi:hypothetical protein
MWTAAKEKTREKNPRRLRSAGKYFLGGLKGPSAFYAAGRSAPCGIATSMDFLK